MAFDFAQLYATYSTPDLVKILESDPPYQADAVAAATHVLRSRNVSQEDYTALVNEMIGLPDKNKRPAVANHDPGSTGIFDNVENFEDTAQAYWWRNIILVFLGLVALNTTGELIYLVFSPRFPLGRLAAVQLAWALFEILCFYLFWKKNKWGWMLIVAKISFTVLNSCITLATGARFYTQGSLFASLFFLGIYGALLYLLFQPGMKRIYQITKPVSYLYAAAGALFVLLEYGALWFQLLVAHF